MAGLTREDLIAAARRASEGSGKTLTRREFVKSSGISEWHINRLFPEGRWTELRTLAGLDRHPLDYDARDTEQLLIEFDRVVKDLGKIPTAALLNKKAQFSYESFKRKFGGLKATVQAYQSWLVEHDPHAEILQSIRTESRHEVPQPLVISKAVTAGPPTKWSKLDGAQYGPPIDFRGLRHAPINEQGVVYLFGVVSYELGFIVESVQGQFPDCDAKRHIGNDRWQRVRIEFEYRSRNFKDHAHDPEGADLVVCWIHDWPECPLEVLDLRSAIDELEG